MLVNLQKFVKVEEGNSVCLQGMRDIGDGH